MNIQILEKYIENCFLKGTIPCWKGLIIFKRRTNNGGNKVD